MFRYIRPHRSLASIGPRLYRRPFLSLSRLPLSLEAKRQAGEITNIQPVRFQKAKWAWAKNVCIAIITTAICTKVYSFVVLEPLVRKLVEAGEHIPKEDLENSTEPYFIPLPGTTKQYPPMPYRGNDPEWLEFVKFNKDKNMAQKVRDELAAYVAHVAALHPMLSVRCGKDMKLRRYWLDVDFPQHAPPIFDRKGIEIGVKDSGEGYIAITRRPVDSVTVGSIRNAMWPKALAISFWSLTKVLVTDESRRLASALGLKSGTPPPAIDRLVTQNQKLLKGPPQVPQLPPSDAPPPKALDGGEKPALMGKGSELGKGTEGAQLTNAIQAYFVKPIAAFKAKLAQTWRPAPLLPARGSILVSGMVELDCPNAWLIFDVKAAWDPKKKEYDHAGILIQLRRMQFKKQAPRP
ncbi:hypothetical protein LZ554_008220 [Drepanopeziza brunnea f. sp. 'monogermtubi']|nr:hypothetical protein LZ554_008220 [Drepanopeziza brunnea f. sp. 'monogermtubi']